MKRKHKYLLAGAILLLLLVFTVYSFFNSKPVGSGGSGGGLAVIRINGAISSTGGDGLLAGGVSASNINRLIRKAAEDTRVKGLLLAIDSPGGSAAGSQEIYRELTRFKKTGKPIVVSMGDAAASGGYYIASQGDYLVASPATATGSIGVIMEILDLSELYDKLGVNSQIIKAGGMKDAGSAARPLGEEERLYFQEMADEIYEQFVADVARARGLPLEDVKKLADGRVIIGSKALELNLVDELGNFNDAFDKLVELAGLKGVPPIIELETKSFWQNFFGLKIQGETDLEGTLLQLFFNLGGAGSRRVKFLF